MRDSEDAAVKYLPDSRQGEAPSEPGLARRLRLGRSLALPSSNSGVDRSRAVVQFGRPALYGGFCSSSGVDDKPGSRV
jgi:hypothetical protein